MSTKLLKSVVVGIVVVVDDLYCDIVNPSGWRMLILILAKAIKGPNVNELKTGFVLSG